MEFIPINKPLLGEEEAAKVGEVMKSGVLTDSSYEGGKYVREFESKCKALLGARHVIALNSGTASLHASLATLGIGKGDEVILPSFTFVATANVVVALGAKPVFADIRGHYNVDVDDVRRKITKKTKAVIPVHLYGFPADMDEVRELAESRSLRLIEDAAESLGATYKGRQTGRLSDAGCFSLYATKVVTSGEGGMVATNDDGIADRIRMIRNHGMGGGHVTRALGYNFRMTEISAAIASVQMDRLGGFIKSRKQNASLLTAEIEGVRGAVLTQTASDRTHVWYLYTLRVAKNRDKILERLREKAIGAAVYWKTPLHKTPFYRGLGYGRNKLPITEDSAAHVISVPVHPGLTRNQREHVARELRAALEQFA